MEIQFNSKAYTLLSSPKESSRLERLYSEMCRVNNHWKNRSIYRYTNRIDIKKRVLLTIWVENYLTKVCGSCVEKDLNLIQSVDLIQCLSFKRQFLEFKSCEIWILSERLKKTIVGWKKIVCKKKTTGWGNVSFANLDIWCLFYISWKDRIRRKRCR